MKPIPYTVIKSKQQYESYQSVLDYLAEIKKKTGTIREIIELLSLLTEKWETDQNKKLPATNPVALLKHLMQKNNLKSIDLAAEISVSKSQISDILCFRRTISKNIRKKLAAKFKVPEELFNKPYSLEN